MSARHGGNIYEAARAFGCDWREVLDFSASINPLGPAPGVSKAICDTLPQIVHYPERESAALRELLADRWGVTPRQILLGNGATELLHFFARAWRSSATLAVPVFSEFHRAYLRAKLVGIDEVGDWPREGLLVLTRPTNPFGRCVPLAVLRRFLSDTTNPVLIDESFIDFTEEESLAAMTAERPALFVLRSLTKFYALPGLRVGALVSSEQLIERLNGTREPWQVNVLAEAAALAAVADLDHATRSVAFVRAEREWLRNSLGSLPGVLVESSVANYIACRLSYRAADLCEHLTRSQILIRNCEDWPGVDGAVVRIAVRTRAENERLVEAWKEFACG